MKKYRSRSQEAPALRFPLGCPVECFVGGDPADKASWVRGHVVKHHYREENWPVEKMSAPYQILLDDAHQRGERNAIWAPADVDTIIRAGFRFKLSDEAECRVAEEEWAKCTVIGLLYREESFPENHYAPYQVRVHGALPATLDTEKLEGLVGTDIWIPADEDEYIRERSEAREGSLRAVEGLHRAKALNEEEYREKRRQILMPWL